VSYVTFVYPSGSSVFTYIGSLGTPSRTGPSLESIYRVSLRPTVNFCEGSKIISFKNYFTTVCPLVKTALVYAPAYLANQMPKRHHHHHHHHHHVRLLEVVKRNQHRAVAQYNSLIVD